MKEARYAWVVVWATFFALGTIFGVSYSFAAYFASFAGEFDARRADVSLVFGLSGGVYFVFGAGGGMLADRFGPRVVTSAGMLLIAAGLLACSFAASMTTVYAAYGMGVGLGIALVYTPSIACVQPWFTRRRGLAAGLGYRRARRPHRPHADAAADAGLGRPGLPRLVCRSGLPDAGLLRALVRPELWRHRLAAARHLHGPVRRARGGRHHRTLYSGAALGNLAGPVLAGAVFDRVGSYLPVLWACIGLSALAAAACARLLASRAPSY